MRLLLTIPGLGPGGAERVMALLAQGFAARGHEVTLLTLSGTGNDFFAVTGAVHRVGLNLIGDSTSRLHASWANLIRSVAVRRVVRAARADAVISFITDMNVLAILACLGLRVPVVVSERIDPCSHRPPRAWSVLRDLTYRRAAGLVVQTKEAADWFAAHLRASPPISVIANPVTSSADAESAPPQARPFLLSAGRLVPQKGFDTLIDAFARADFDDAMRLVIVGEGPEEENLRRRLREHRLEARVSLAGRVRSLPSLMKQATAFVLSSRYEGFPNVLLEALANGLAVVATDCPGGAREILAGGQFGLLVPCDDATALSGAMERIVDDAALRDRLASQGPAAVSRYDLDTIVAQWERVLSRFPQPG